MLTEQRRVFEDRKSAGIQLGKLLEPKYKNSDPIILGIPRGGVIVAHEVAKILKAELSVIIAKRILHPYQNELVIGAVAEDGSSHFTPVAKELNRGMLQQILSGKMTEIERYKEIFRNGEDLPELKDRHVILVDDGMATASTLITAVKLCLITQAKHVVVAVPIAGKNYSPLLNGLADEVVIAYQPEFFYAIGQAYDNFYSIADADVSGLLRRYKKSPKETVPVKLSLLRSNGYGGSRSGIVF